MCRGARTESDIVAAETSKVKHLGPIDSCPVFLSEKGTFFFSVFECFTPTPST